MFSECISLKNLIISNFNFAQVNIDNMDEIIKDSLQQIEYIDISNINDPNNHFGSYVYINLNNKNNLTVCQKTNVIKNQNANYKCYNFSFDSLVCDNIQTTIPMIQTTIPIIQTTNPKIHTTIPMIQTTIPKIQTTFPQIPKMQSEETLLILFGFNYFRLSSSTMSFNVLFAQVLNEIYTNSIKVALIIN